MRRVVLLPGLDGTGALFAGLIRAAGTAARLEPVALPPEPLGYAALAERLGPALGLTRDTILVAESFSGPLAASLAAAYPVAALVLCNSFVEPPRTSKLRLVAWAPRKLWRDATHPSPICAARPIDSYRNRASPRSFARRRVESRSCRSAARTSSCKPLQRRHGARSRTQPV